MQYPTLIHAVNVSRTRVYFGPFPCLASRHMFACKIA